MKLVLISDCREGILLQAHLDQVGHFTDNVFTPLRKVYRVFINSISRLRTVKYYVVSGNKSIKTCLIGERWCNSD